MARSPSSNAQSRAALPLALFVLGVMVSLLALLGRVGQELEGRLLFDLSRSLTRGAGEAQSDLPAMIDGLRTPGQRLVALGFAVGAVALLAGGIGWMRIGFPREALSARLAGAIAACLLLGMLAALVGHPPGARLAVVGISLALALVGFVLFVLMLVRGVPPAP